MSREQEIRERLEKHTGLNANKFVTRVGIYGPNQDQETERPETSYLAVADRSVARIYSMHYRDDEGREFAEFSLHAPEDLDYLLKRNEALENKINEIAEITEDAGALDVFTTPDLEYTRHLVSVIDRVDKAIIAEDSP